MPPRVATVKIPRKALKAYWQGQNEGRRFPRMTAAEEARFYTDLEATFRASAAGRVFVEQAAAKQRAARAAKYEKEVVKNLTRQVETAQARLAEGQRDGGAGRARLATARGKLGAVLSKRSERVQEQVRARNAAFFEQNPDVAPPPPPEPPLNAFQRAQGRKFKFSLSTISVFKRRVEAYSYSFSDTPLDMVVQPSALGEIITIADTLPKSMAAVVKYSIFAKDILGKIVAKLPCRMTMTGYALFVRVDVDPITREKKTVPFIKHIHLEEYVTLRNRSEVVPAVNGAGKYMDNELERTADSARFLGYLGLKLSLLEHAPLTGGSYFPLPARWANKKATINIQNKQDELCFLYCLAYHLMPEKPPHHPERVNWYLDHLDLVKLPPGMKFPPQPSDFAVVEELNNLQLSVKLLELDPKDKREKEDDAPKERVVPFYAPRRREGLEVNLLLVHDSEAERSHYVIITNMSRLLASEISMRKCSMHFCHHCDSHFPSEESLRAHKELFECGSHGCVLPTMPKETEPGKGVWLSFNNHHHQLRVPYTYYADCESMMVYKEVPVEPVEGDEAPKTRQLCEQVPVSYRYVRVDWKGETTTAAFTGLDAREQFVHAIIEDAQAIQEKYREASAEPVPVRMSDAQKQQHTDADKCYLCRRLFDSDRIKIIEHDHLTGEYRGAACEACNKKCRMDSLPINVFFHNGKGYDFHTLMVPLAKKATFDDAKLSCIALNTEKSLAVMYGKKIQFKDSIQFMSASLEKVIESQRDSGLDFPITRAHFTKLGHSPEDIDLILRKGLFPYEWFDSLDKLDHVGLPPREAFHSRLSGKGISAEEYAHALKVYEAFNCRTFRDYHDIYLAVDVTALADCFENFRTRSLAHFGLDPCYYFTAPGLSWDAALFKTGVRLELLQDIDMFLFFERQSRGGVSMISHRYAEAPADGKGSAIGYYDANNLYGWAMCEPLPESDYKWMAEADVAALDAESILAMDPMGKRGCTLMVDLEYPVALHDAHNDYPLAPETMVVTPEMASPYTHAVCEAHKMKLDTCRKLVPNLRDKERYVVSLRNLQLYLRLGLKLKKVHRVVSYKQSAWLKPYIQWNTLARQAAKRAGNLFDADFFKLMNNAVFGKTMENVRNRENITLWTSNQRFLNRVLASPALKNLVIFDEDLVAVVKHKTHVKLNKPVQVGMAILDLSKVCMYDFHYNVMMRKYGHERCRLLLTDTDSLVYHITTPDLNADLAGPDLNPHFDFSEYPKDHPLYSSARQAVPGLMKCETGGARITQLVGLKPKMYAYLCPAHVKEEKREQHRAKGVKKSVEVCFEQYRDALFTAQAVMVTQCTIRSRKHRLFTEEQTRLGLSPVDTKRYILPDGISTLALGHCKIPKP